MNIKIALFAVALGTTSYATEFNEVVAHPQAFHNKVVSVIGLAMVEADSFDLFENVSAVSQVDLSRAIYVRQGSNVGSYDRFNNRWVRLTGIVDADHHGPLRLVSATGAEIGGRPCEISLEKVELLNRPPEKQWPRDLGQFKNETSGAVRVFLSTGADDYYGIFTLGPGGVGGTALHPGTVATVTPRGKESVVLVPEGKRIVKDKLLIPPRTRRPDEPTDRIFYYRITEGKIESVPTQDAKDWPLPPGFTEVKN
jgi:hypothetical protein